MSDSNALNKYFATIPKVYNPQYNPVILALLTAMALSDDDVENSIAIARANLFVRTATGEGLNSIGNSLGVSRPQGLGLDDTTFQNLIPNLSLKPKTIRKAFYDTADVFWGPGFSRINLTSNNFGPFNIHAGDTFIFQIDNNDPQTVVVLASDVASPGLATATEVQAILSKFKNATASITTDSLTGNQYINIMTQTPGSTGRIQILGGTGVAGNKLDLTVGSYDILDLPQRVSIYNVNSNEIIIELPAIIPALRRVLRGSHHFHADSTLASPVPPANGIWQGSFLYNPKGDVESVTITGQNCQLQGALQKGQVYTAAFVDDTSKFLEQSGTLMVGYGTDHQEGPIRFRGVANSHGVLLDPSYTFKFDQPIGTYLNVVGQKSPYVPVKTGKDLAVYLTSPSGARTIVQQILASLAAAGVSVTFVVLSPKYKYIIDNPYLPEQEPLVNPNDP